MHVAACDRTNALLSSQRNQKQNNTEHTKIGPQSALVMWRQGRWRRRAPVRTLSLDLPHICLRHSHATANFEACRNASTSPTRIILVPHHQSLKNKLKHGASLLKCFICVAVTRCGVKPSHGCRGTTSAWSHPHRALDLCPRGSFKVQPDRVSIMLVL